MHPRRRLREHGELPGLGALPPRRGVCDATRGADAAEHLLEGLGGGVDQPCRESVCGTRARMIVDVTILRLASSLSLPVTF